MARLTPLEALRQAYAIADHLVKEDAIKLLISEGHSAQDARRDVQAAFKEHFAVSGAV